MRCHQDRFTIYEISNSLESGAIEYMGGKVKGWITFTLNGTDTRVMFKEGRSGTGENWAEKVACELAGFLNLPRARYELAYVNKNKPCVISPNFLKEGEQLVHGNQLVAGFDQDQKFKHTQHTLSEILSALVINKVQVPDEIRHHHPMINEAKDLFIGYLCFDAWIANTDRHAENWGMIINLEHVNSLAPTFDHASSLGRNENDAKRKERMKTRDLGYNVQAYVKRAQTAIYDDHGGSKKPLCHKDLIIACKSRAPHITDYWIEKISDIMEQDGCVKELLDRVPDEFMSEIARNFAIEILRASTKILQEL